jgi:hypothetical protein
LAGQAWALYSLRILIVFALADISLRFVELPIRRGVIQYWIKGRKYRTKRERNRQTYVLSVATVIVIVIASIVSVRAISIANRAQLALEESLTVEESNVQSTVNGGLWVTGDSVILGIRSVLEENQPITLVNARIGRQASELLDVILQDQQLATQSPVVFNLGNNGALSRSEVEAIFEALKNQPQIVVVNTAVPRPWRDANNQLIGEIAEKYSQASVVDWNTLSTGRPEFFAPDGVHLVPAGVNAYVAAILENLQKK